MSLWESRVETWEGVRGEGEPRAEEGEEGREEREVGRGVEQGRGSGVVFCGLLEEKLGRKMGDVPERMMG